MTMTTTPTTMPLDAQLKALTSVGSMPPNYRNDSARRFDPTDTAGPLRELVPKLRAVGIEPTDSAKYDRLTAITLDLPSEPAGRRLDLSPTDYERRLRDVAAYYSGYREGVDQTQHERVALQRELRQSMHDEADDYLTALRPAFDRAMVTFQTASGLGITLATSPEDAMDLGPKAVTAWRAMTGTYGTSRALDGIAGLRIRMCTALGVEPVNTQAHAKPISYGPCFGGDPAAFDDNQGWRRWLAVAQTGTAALLPVGA